jgi:hypothetical protein
VFRYCRDSTAVKLLECELSGYKTGGEELMSKNSYDCIIATTWLQVSPTPGPQITLHYILPTG